MKAIICGARIARLTLAWWLERDFWEVLPELRRANPRTTRLSFVDQSEHGEGRLGYSRVASVLGGLVIGARGRYLRHVGHRAASFTLSDGDIERRVGDRPLMLGAPGRRARLYPTDDGRLSGTRAL
ncbi:hypothetical protein V1634_28150 [Plantactinospora veratri]|uniref:Uncharacterized protein n=1 Tax=Plantactinospora veratri TaxID=1436122 RepID=A0ABU7SL72_9ACTN